VRGHVSASDELALSLVVLALEIPVKDLLLGRLKALA
jgi:hypothetical protein